jgi:hypothetical protein
MEAELNLDPDSNPDPESDPELITDPDPNLQIISDTAGSGSGCTTLALTKPNPGYGSVTPNRSTPAHG